MNPKITYADFLKSLSLISVLLCTQPAYSSGNAAWIGDSVSGAPCRGRDAGYGPFDYTKRSSYSENFNLIEKAHFDQNVESLRGGAKGKSQNPLPDLDYTLRAVPNHHRALNTVIIYQLRSQKTFKYVNLSPAECYLQRAINYSPNDATAHMLYGMFLDRTNHLQDALNQYQTAIKLAPGDIQIKYNYGLLLVDLKRYDEAKKLATDVYRQNYPLTGLKNQLTKAGYW